MEVEVDRQDGRSGQDLRKIAMKLGVVSQADGSAQFSMGQTSVLVSVNGPGPVKARHELSDQATLQVTVQPLNTPPGIGEAMLACTIEKILQKIILLHLYPRSLISVFVQPTSIDGSLLACMINATMAALLDSNIPLRTTISAVCGVVTPGGSIWFDPSAHEESASPSSFWFAIDPAQSDDGAVISYSLNGQANSKGLDLLYVPSLAVAKHIHLLTKSAIEQHCHDMRL